MPDRRHLPDAIPRPEGPRIEAPLAPLATPRQRSIHRYLTLGLQIIVLAGLVVSVLEGRWLNTVVITLILVLTALPWILGRRFQVFIPPEFEVAAILFIFASLYLGSIRDYYDRFWWWDVALHTSSGFLLGILGFLLVYVLNSEPRISLHMKPGFVALFSFVFAVALGALWEVVEFAVDQSTGLGMQRGLDDTMWDLIVDSVGALAISLLGYAHLKSGEPSFLERGIRSFIEANPRLFRVGNDPKS